jgi:hypothetical protein
MPFFDSPLPPDLAEFFVDRAEEFSDGREGDERTWALDALAAAWTVYGPDAPTWRAANALLALGLTKAGSGETEPPVEVLEARNAVVDLLANLHEAMFEESGEDGRKGVTFRRMAVIDDALSRQAIAVEAWKHRLIRGRGARLGPGESQR